MGIVILLMLCLWLFVRSSYGQNKLLPWATNYISKLIGTEVTADRVSISFFDEATLYGVIMKDAEKDTIAHIGVLNVDIDLFSLFGRQLHLNSINISEADIKLSANEEGILNIQHILDKLKGENSAKIDTNVAAKSWKLDLKGIELKNVNFLYSTSTDQINLVIPSFDGLLNEFDTDNLIFHFSKASPEILKFDYFKTTKLSSDHKELIFPKLPFTFIVDDLDLSMNVFNYVEINEKLDSSHFQIKELALKIDDFYWKDSIQANLKQLDLQSNRGYALKNFTSHIQISDTQLSLRSANLSTSNSKLSFDLISDYTSLAKFVNDFPFSKTKINIDKSHFGKEDLLLLNDIFQFKDVRLDRIAAVDFQGLLGIDNNNIVFDNVEFVIPDKINFHGSGSIVNIFGEQTMSFEVDIPKLKTSQSNILFIFPNIKFPEEIRNVGNITASLNASGTKNKVHFKHIKFVSSIGTTLHGKGSISNFTKPFNPSFDLNLTNLESDLHRLFADTSLLPDPIRRLEKINYKGQAKGTFHDFILKGNLSSSLGQAIVDVKANFDDSYTQADYKGYVDLMDFDLGTMLNDTTFGIVSAQGDIEGSGLNLNDLKIDSDIKIKSFDYDGYTYEDISIKGLYQKDVFLGKIISNDKNLKINFDGMLDLNSDLAKLEFEVDLGEVDLKELGLTDDYFKIKGILRGSFIGNELDNIEGKGTISKLTIISQYGEYSTQEEVAIEVKDLDKQLKSYEIQSPFLDLQLSGNIKPTQLFQKLSNYIDAHIPVEFSYSKTLIDTTSWARTINQNFTANIETKEIDRLIYVLTGNNFKLKRTTLGASFSSNESKLDIKGRFDSLEYRGYLIPSGSYFFKGNQDQVNGEVTFENFGTLEDVLIPKSVLSADLNKKTANLNLTIRDQKDISRLMIGGDLSRTHEYIFSFHEQVFINSSSWNFSPYNQVFYGENGLFLQDVSIRKDNQIISIYTDENENGSAIEMLFNEFNISEFSSIIETKNDYFEGGINGALVINSLDNKPFLTTDLKVTDIKVGTVSVGDLVIKAFQDNTKKEVIGKALLQGSQNDVTLDLKYGIDNQEFDGNLIMNSFRMNSLDLFLDNYINKSSGTIDGSISFNGSIDNLELKGKIATHDLETIPVLTNIRYKIADQNIDITNERIEFGTIVLTDPDNHTARITGKIIHQNLRNSFLDFIASTAEFNFLNTTSVQNELFYGSIKAKANVAIYGPIDEILITGSAKSLENSILTVSPLALESELLNDDFIVYGDDPRKVETDSTILDENAFKKVFPFEIDINLEVDEKSKFEFVVNPISGDIIKCAGNSNLIFKLKQNGEIELYGTYTVTGGSYTFTYGIISKDFKIQPNSTVIFNGNALDGILNVKAIYSTKTAVYNLLQLESDLADNLKAEARRKKDINVILNLSSSILHPEFSLDIVAANNDLSSIKNILNTKLDQLRTDPDELNKQVFGLLLFDNFIVPNNLATDLTQVGTDLAISSLSGLVTQQLNKLAGSLIQGFEVNFDVNSYSSEFLATGESGLVTELGVGISKSLFNERLTVSAGTNINLESTSAQSAFNNIAGDFVLQYKLDEDGSFSVKAFRQSSVDRVIDENTSKNGVSVYIRKEFGEVRKKENPKKN